MSGATTSVHRSLLALVLVASLASCASFEFQRQRVFLRYFPETDVLDALLVYEGVGGRAGRGLDQEKEDREAAEVIGRIAQGRHHFLLWNWPFDVDLPEIMGKLDREDALAQRFLDFTDCIQVMESRLVRGPTEAPCLLQRIRIRNAATGLRLLDAGFNRMILHDWSDDDAAVDDDPETNALWLRRAQEDGAWARFDGGALVVSVPTTPRGAASGLNELFEDDDELTPQVLRSMTALEITGEVALLRFAPGEDGWIRFSIEDPERGIARGASDILAERGSFSAGELEAEIRRLLALE